MHQRIFGIWHIQDMKSHTHTHTRVRAERTASSTHLHFQQERSRALHGNRHCGSTPHPLGCPVGRSSRGRGFTVVMTGGEEGMGGAGHCDEARLEHLKHAHLEGNGMK